MRRYPLLAGTLFGTLQTGYFLQLSFAFSSAAITLFSVTLAWLAGSVVGLWAARRLRLRWWQVGGLGVAGYLACSGLLATFPLQDSLLPVYLGLVALSGTYAGWFFGTAGQRFSGRVGRLFFWENNGFLMGIVLGTVLFIYLGRPVLWLLPVALLVTTFPSPELPEGNYV